MRQEEAQAALRELGIGNSIDVSARIVSAPEVGGSPGHTPANDVARRAGRGF